MSNDGGKLPASKEELQNIPAEHWKSLLAGEPEELAKWLEAAAALGDAHAQLMLGQMCLDGRGVVLNAGKAFEYFVASSEQKNAMAMNMRARCLEHGWGTARNLQEAAVWYGNAADAGLDWGMYNLANLFATGRGVTCDQKQAFDLYARAAGLGHAKSLNLVGRYYEDGIVVEANRDTAFEYYRASAMAGDFRGQYSYACMLAERGRIDQANTWLKKIPETATPAFMKKIGAELQLSAHASFRSFADEMLKKANASR